MTVENALHVAREDVEGLTIDQMIFDLYKYVPNLFYDNNFRSCTLSI